MSAPGSSNSQREFLCGHCHGKIFIPWNLPPTTAPCPHCGQTITSPPLEEPVALTAAPLPTQPPVTSAPVVGAPAAIPSPPIEVAMPVATGPLPVVVEAPAPPETQPQAVIPVPESYAPVIAPESVRPATPSAEDEPPPLPARRVRAASIQEEHLSEPSPREKKSSLLVPILVMLLLLLLAGGMVVYFWKRGDFKVPQLKIDLTRQAKIKEDAYQNEGWKQDAVAVLGRFIDAPTAEGKAAYVLNPEQELPEMKAFYGAHKVDDSDTPASAFASYPLSESDRDRGMFMLMFDQPAQLKLSEAFYPLSTLELQNGLEDPDMLLSSAASASNFAQEQIKVQALFMQTKDGLKLDWPTFAQTKYRLFREFIDRPKAGAGKVFRVLIQEDVPEKGRITQGVRSYKVYDPGNISDYARVAVPVDSDTGRSLSEINWIGTRNARMDWRTATVELAWSTEETPQLTLKNFVCWEFLGLGGKPKAAGK